MLKFCRLGWWCVIGAFLTLGAAQAEAQSVTLAWDPNSEPDLGGYLIGYGTVPGQDHQLIDVGASTMWTLHGFAEGTTYYFRVYAYSTSGLRSTPSADIQTTIAGGVPSGGGSSSPSSPAGCQTPDPFVSLGGGTCSNGNWLPPGFAPSAGSPPPPPPSTPLPPPPPPTSGGCVGTDPFSVLGGGTCVNGNWLPPGMTGVVGSAPAPTPPASPSHPAACIGSDPFTSLGGGHCFEGNWLPPGMANTTSCVGPDPFVTLGGGTCDRGNWLPPGLVLRSSSMGSPSSAASPSSTCSTPDPFVSVSGLIGVCQKGGWVPVPGVNNTGTVRVFSLKETFWGIAGDDGRVYRPASLDSAMRVEGLHVTFKGTTGDQMMMPTPVTNVDLRSITVR